MEWYTYVAAFFAGAFFANVVPHFVHGISGNKFPTPFAKPPGKGLSSPLVNVVWALINLFFAYLLFGAGKIVSGDKILMLLFFAGIVFISIACSINFSKKHTD